MKCEWCGKEIVGRRANAKYCSEECRLHMAHRYASEYIKERTKKDEEFKERRKSSSRQYAQRRREQERARILTEKAKEICEIYEKDHNPTTVKEYLDANFRIKW